MALRSNCCREFWSFGLVHVTKALPARIKRTAACSSGYKSPILLGLRPRVLLPVIRPISNPTCSSTESFADAWLRSTRMARVSQPWVVFACAQRCRPASVFGPVEAPPWKRHLVLPFEAGARHCCFVRLDLAWQRVQVMRPPRVRMVCSKSRGLDMDLHLM